MVRRDCVAERVVKAKSEAAHCCTFPASESLARVSAGAPGSRVQPWLARDVAERIVESLEGGSNEAGRNAMNAEQASSKNQPKGVWEGRAGHVTAKAMHSVLVPEWALGFPGVWAAACFEGKVRNTRDPDRRPTSGKCRAYKARAEVARCRQGVRGARSTAEGGDKLLEGRGP